MKKIFFYTLLLIGCLGMVTACGDDNPDENPPGQGENGGNGPGGNTQSPITVNTAEDAQNEFDRVGQELIRKIDANKFKPLVNLARYCDETFFYDDDEVFYPEYMEEPSYRLKAIMRHISTTAQGNFAGVASVKRIVETYSLDDYTGVYTWDESMEEWKKQPSTNELTYKFDDQEGKPCVVTVKKNGTEYTWNVKDEWGQVTEQVKVPSNLTATITDGGTQLASFDLQVPKCDQNGKNYALNAQLKVSDYIIKGEATNNNATAKATYSMKLNNETLIEGTAEVNGNKLADDNAFIQDEMERDDVTNGSATYTLLGSINLNIKADNSKGLLDALDFDGYYSRYEYKYNYMDEPSIWKESDKETAEGEAREAAQKANDYIQSNITFAKGSYAPHVDWEPYLSYEYNDSWGPEADGYYYKSEGGEWDIRPVIVFDNDGRYSFEEYFNETRFSSVISVFESLMEDFERL